MAAIAKGGNKAKAGIVGAAGKVKGSTLSALLKAKNGIVGAAQGVGGKIKGLTGDVQAKLKSLLASGKAEAADIKAALE